MKSSKKIFDKIKSSKSLPSLPQVLLKLIEACNNDETTPKELSQIISKDPSLSTRVMRLVNSPYAGLINKVKSIEQGVLYLGSDTIKNIAISASVLQVFSHMEGNSFFKLSQFWWHSFMCASIARSIAKKISYPSPEEAFLSGLMHDIGKLLLWVNFTEDYSAIITDSGNNIDLLITGEKKLGATHCEVGAWLIRQWNLKSLMADAVLYHHEPIERISDAFPLVKIVYVANALCQVHTKDSRVGLKAAEAVFGFSLSQVEEISFGAKEEVTDVAQSLEIAIEPPSIAEITGPENESGKIEDLLFEVRNTSLLYGTLQNLLKADSKDSILKVVERGLQILFDVKRIFFFLCESEKDLLVGSSPKGDSYDELINDLAVPFKSGKSLLVRSLSGRDIVNSFGKLTSDAITIADEQIIRLLGTDGMLCLPMLAHKKHVGVIVLGIDKPLFRRLSEQLKLLNMLANHAAMCLHVEEIKQNQARRIQSERLKASSAIARKIVHEVNNPLGIIKNYIKILELKLPEKNLVQDELRIISEEIDRVVQINSQLSAFSQPKIKKFEPVDINTLISDFLKITKKSILSPSMIDVHLSLAPSLPKVSTEKNSLKQVFINLIKNAAEAMPEGGNIYVKTRHVGSYDKRLIGDTEEALESIEITVRDDGPGIPDSIKPRLFEPLNSSKPGHSGLGLSIVHSIIKNLNGTITCESDRNTGTCFKIVLPLSGNG